MPTIQSPTEDEMAILRTVSAFIGERGYSPSFRDMTEYSGTSSNSVTRYRLLRLEELGLVRWDARIARSVIVTDAGRKLLRSK